MTTSRCKNRIEAKRSMLLFRELGRRAAGETAVGRDGVRPEPDRVPVRRQEADTQALQSG
jgi:hypothetical protein